MIEDKSDESFPTNPIHQSLTTPITTTTTTTTINNKPSSIKKWQKSRILKHHHNQWKSLFRSTLPIFIAATISKAISQLLEFIIGSGNITTRILIELFYTITIAHVIGYLVNMFIPIDHPLFQYYLTLATDNASFAWSSTLTLIILKVLYRDSLTIPDGWILVLFIWILLIAFVCLIIYIGNYFQAVYFHLSISERRWNLRCFESECFSLSIAYSITVIIAVFIYQNESTDYLSNTDDINSTNDDNLQENQYNWLFLIYISLITIGMLSYQAWMNRRIKRKKMKEVAKVLIERTSFSGRPVGEEGEEEEEVEGIRTHPPQQQQQPYWMINNPKAKTLFQEDEPDCLDKIENSILKIYHRIMFWDSDHQAYVAFATFYYTTLAYTVSCGWYMWSILTLQNLFHFPGGQIVGLTIYAVVATLVVVFLLTVLSVKEEISGLSIDAQTSEDSNTISKSSNQNYYNQNQKVTKSFDKLEKKSILYYAFSRLTIGMAWQQLFITLVAEIVPRAQTDRDGYVALVKIIAAIFLFFLGCRVEMFLYHRKQKRRNSSNDSNGSFGNAEETSTFLYDIIEADEEYEEPLL